MEITVSVKTIEDKEVLHGTNWTGGARVTRQITSEVTVNGVVTNSVTYMWSDINGNTVRIE